MSLNVYKSHAGNFSDYVKEVYLKLLDVNVRSEYKILVDGPKGAFNPEVGKVRPASQIWPSLVFCPARGDNFST